MKAETELHLIQERLRLALESVNDGIWDWNVKSGDVYWSPRSYTMLGYEPDEFVVTYPKWASMVHPEDLDSAESIIQESVKSGVNFRIEYRFKNKDGSWLWLLTRGKCIERDDKGLPLRIIGTNIDLTQRKLDEAELRKNESELNAIYENAPLLMLLVDKERRVIKMNDQALKFSGRTKNECAGLRGGEVLRCVHSLDNPKGCGYGPACKECGIRNAILETFNGRPVQCKEIILPYKDPANPINVCVLISTKQLEGFEKDVVLVCLEDITERKQIENELRKEKEFTDVTLDSLQDTFFLFEPNTGIPVRWNNSFREITGYSDLEITKLPAPLAYFQDKDKDLALDFMHKVLANGCGSIELDLLCKDGHTIPFEYIVSTIYNENSVPKYLIAIGRDITDRKNAEKNLKENENLLSASFSSIQDGMLILDKNLNIIRTNPVIKKWCGNDLTGNKLKCYRSFRNHTAPCDTCPSVRALKSGNAEFGVLNGFPGSEIEWLEVYSYPIKNTESGEITGVVEFLRDITERKHAEKALLDSEAKLREAQQMAQLGHWYWEVSTGKVEWSEQVYKIFGLSAEEFIPEINSILEMSPWPETRRRDKELIDKAVANHSKGDYEQKFLRPNGTIGYYYSTFQGVYNSDGDLMAIKGTVQDITERKQAEQELLKQRERLDLAQEAAGIGMYDWDVINDEAVCSGRFFEIFGIESQEKPLAQSQWQSMVYPEDRSRTLNEVNDSLCNGADYDTEYRIVWPDGSIKWVGSKAKVFCDSDGKAYRMIGTMTDITTNKQLALQLNMISNAIEKSINAFDIVDHNGNLIYVNKAYLDMWGYDSADEIIGTSPVSHCADSSIPAQIIGKLKADGECILEFKARRKDGSLFDVLMCASLDYDFDGNEIYLGTSIDITDRKKNEETIKNYNIRLQEEVRDRTKELSNKNESLKNEITNRIKAENELKAAVSQLIQSEKLATVGQLAAGVAHEINTPLGAIGSSNTTILQQFEGLLGNIEDEFKILKENLDLIKTLIIKISKSSIEMTSRQTRQMKSLLTEQLSQQGVNDPDAVASFLVSVGLIDDYQVYLPLFNKDNSVQILNFIRRISNIISGSKIIDTAVKQSSRVVYALRDYARVDPEERFIEADIKDTIETAIVLNGNKVKHGIELKADLDDVPHTMCRPHELCQVWTNLVSNAVYAMGEVGTLTITLKCVKNNINVIIADTGCGIPEDIKTQIYDPMFTTKPVGEGTGLGLDIVKRIIDRHNGTLQMESQVGVGTTFTISIPVIEPALVF